MIQYYYRNYLCISRIHLNQASLDLDREILEKNLSIL